VGHDTAETRVYRSGYAQARRDEDLEVVSTVQQVTSMNTAKPPASTVQHDIDLGTLKLAAAPMAVTKTIETREWRQQFSTPWT